jgi:hypothetical protein
LPPDFKKVLNMPPPVRVYGLDGGDDDGPIGGVGDRHAIDEVVIAADGTAGDGDLGAAALVFHAVVVRVANGCDVLRELRHHEGIAAEVGEIGKLLIVDDLTLRGVGGFDE